MCYLILASLPQNGNALYALPKRQIKSVLPFILFKDKTRTKEQMSLKTPEGSCQRLE
jgi:hypothetical protein